MHLFPHRAACRGSLPAILVVALSCAAPAPEHVADTPAVTPAGAVREAVASFSLVVWHPHAMPVADYGRGVVTLPGAGEGVLPTGVAGSLPRTDTLMFRSQPDSAAPVVGLLLVRSDTAASEQAWRHAVVAPRLAAPNLVEFGYEEAGIPIDSAASGGRWLRARLGTDSGGQWLTRWADAHDTRLESRWWADHLSRQSLFALDSTKLPIAREAEGARLPLATTDHILHGADSVRGRWLLVTLVTPSDYCAGDDKTVRRRQRVWVEYLDARGRPRVWYHSRGC